MRHSPLLHLAVVALAVLAPAARGQDFPPPGQAARLHLADDSLDIGPILGGGIGWAGPFSLNTGDERSAWKDFKAGRSLHGLAGVRFGGFGLAAILRRAEPGVAASPLACPGGGCSATSSQVGGLVMFNSAADPGSPIISIGLGFWTDKSEISDAGGGLVRRYEGWALFEYVSVEARLGGPTGHFGLGGYGILAFTSPDRVVVPGGSSSYNNPGDTPGWAELGLRVSFY